MARVKVVAYITPLMEDKIMLNEEVLDNVGAYVTYPCRTASHHIEPPPDELPPIDPDLGLNDISVVLIAYVSNLTKANQLKNYILAVARPEDQILMELTEVNADIFVGRGTK